MHSLLKQLRCKGQRLKKGGSHEMVTEMNKFNSLSLHNIASPKASNTQFSCLFLDYRINVIKMSKG